MHHVVTIIIIIIIGERHMLMNVHSLLHLPEVAEDFGPLWAHSCFPYENANGELLKLLHGSQCVEKQVLFLATWCNVYIIAIIVGCRPN